MMQGFVARGRLWLLFQKVASMMAYIAENAAWVRTLCFTSVALMAFAANSVLCRLALGTHAMDAASFTVIRLLSAVLMLGGWLLWQRKSQRVLIQGRWSSAWWLFVYAACFSWAYVSLDTGTGALILFGSVQLTMMVWAMRSGQRLHVWAWLGVVLACLGLVYLVLPRVSTPSVLGFVLMVCSGVAWGLYSLHGKASRHPLHDTASNFLRTLPFVALLALATLWHAHASWAGVLWAVLSGALASGLGYALWYMALAGWTTMQASVLQLSVPLIAALGGVLFVGEAMSLRLLLASAMILGGVYLVLRASSHDD